MLLKTSQGNGNSQQNSQTMSKKPEVQNNKSLMEFMWDSK